MKVLSLWVFAVAICAVSVDLSLASTQVMSRQLTQSEKEAIRGGASCSESSPGTKRCSDCIGPIPSTGTYEKCFATTLEMGCKPWTGSGIVMTCTVTSPSPSCGGWGSVYSNPTCSGYSGQNFSCQLKIGASTQGYTQGGSCPP